MSREILDRHGVNVHPLADVFHLEIGGDMFNDIQDNGVRHPITWSHDGGTLLDGRTRLAAWLMLGRTVETCPSVRLPAADDAALFIVASNLMRRQLSKAQKALAAARALPYYSGRHGGDRSEQGSGNGTLVGKSIVLAGGAFGVGKELVYRAAQILEDNKHPMIVAAIDAGKMNIPQALAAMDKREATPAEPFDLKWRMGEQLIVDVANIKAMRELHRQLTAELARIDNP